MNPNWYDRDTSKHRLLNERRNTPAMNMGNLLLMGWNLNSLYKDVVYMSPTYGIIFAMLHV